MPGFSAGAAVVRPLSFEASRDVPDGPVPASRAWATPLTSSAASAAAEKTNACFIDVSPYFPRGRSAVPPRQTTKAATAIPESSYPRRQRSAKRRKTSAKERGGLTRVHRLEGEQI